MSKKISFLIIFISTAIFVATGFMYKANQTTFLPTEPKEVDSVILTPVEPEIVTSVSLEEKVGKLFLIGHWANTSLSSTTELINKHHLGGIVIMSAPENYDEIKNWTNIWQEASPQELLIAIDQEGGPVSRLKGDAFVQTSQREISDEKTAYNIGEIRGQELRSLGINMNFAPVLDIAENPDSFMYERSFPIKAESANMAAAMLKGMAASSVTGVVKHFPGHDDTPDDSHLVLPTVNIERDEIDTFTSQFSELIKYNEPEAVMTAHILFPKIDITPASLSTFFLTEYLRDTLRYTGIIITDDMSMKAITDSWTNEEASVLALQAGADIILFAAEPERVTAAITAVIAAVQTGRLTEERITESYERVISLEK